MKNKKCSQCKIDKPIVFYYQSDTEDKLSNSCKECLSKRQKGYYKEKIITKPDYKTRKKVFKDLAEKWCPSHLKYLPIADFNKSPSCYSGYEVYCRVCKAVRVKEQYSYSKKKSYHYKSKFGISLEEFDVLFLQQQSKCKACKSTEHNGRNWSVDHEHIEGYADLPSNDKKKYIRGILCHPCNAGLGLFKNSIEKLESAIQYLKDYQARKST